MPSMPSMPSTPSTSLRYCLCHSGPPPLPLWLLTAWPGGAAWCRAALGRGLVVVWLYERPGLAFPYPLRVHPVWCLPAARGLVAQLQSGLRTGRFCELFASRWIQSLLGGLTAQLRLGRAHITARTVSSHQCRPKTEASHHPPGGTPFPLRLRKSTPRSANVFSAEAPCAAGLPGMRGQAQRAMVGS